jgi:uncharacterized membrane protein YeaQ/YmgE (transglycosylase-associated protein family)
MIYVILVVFLFVVGLLIGWLAGLLWKSERPYGLLGDLGISLVTTFAVGLLDWFLIPALGFSNNLKYMGVAIEPALAALFVLWIVRKRANR